MFFGLSTLLPGCGGGSNSTSPNNSAPACYFPISINYDKPELYVNEGTQSGLSDSYFSEIQSQISITSHNLVGIGQIYKWIINNFATSPNDGATIGKVDVNMLYAAKTLTGCSDYALLMSSVLRRFGYPVIMVHTAGIQWAEQYRINPNTPYQGHAFIEVYLDGKWILVDSTTGQYALIYNHNNPVIPIKKPVENKGYYVLYKGLDPADYGVTSLSILEDRMRDFSLNLDKITIVYPSYQIGKF